MQYAENLARRLSTILPWSNSGVRDVEDPDTSNYVNSTNCEIEFSEDTDRCSIPEIYDELPELEAPLIQGIPVAVINEGILIPGVLIVLFFSINTLLFLWWQLGHSVVNEVIPLRSGMNLHIYLKNCGFDTEPSEYDKAYLILRAWGPLLPEENALLDNSINEPFLWENDTLTISAAGPHYSTYFLCQVTIIAPDNFAFTHLEVRYAAVDDVMEYKSRVPLVVDKLEVQVLHGVIDLGIITAKSIKGAISDGSIRMNLGGDLEKYDVENPSSIVVSSKSAPVTIYARIPIDLTFSEASAARSVIRGHGLSVDHFPDRRIVKAYVWSADYNSWTQGLYSVSIVIHGTRPPVYVHTYAELHNPEAGQQTWAGIEQQEEPHFAEHIAQKIKALNSWITEDQSAPWILMLGISGTPIEDGIFRFISSHAYRTGNLKAVLLSGGMLLPRHHNAKLHILGLYCRPSDDEEDLPIPPAVIFQQPDGRPVHMHKGSDPRYEPQRRYHRQEIPPEIRSRAARRVLRQIIHPEGWPGAMIGSTFDVSTCIPEILDATFSVLYEGLSNSLTEKTVMDWTEPEFEAVRLLIHNDSVVRSRPGMMDSWFFFLASVVNAGMSLCAALAGMWLFVYSAPKIVSMNKNLSSTIRAASHRLSHEGPYSQQKGNNIWNINVTRVYWPVSGFVLRWNYECRDPISKLAIRITPQEDFSMDLNKKENSDVSHKTTYTSNSSNDTIIYINWNLVRSEAVMGVKQKQIVVPFRSRDADNMETTQRYFLEPQKKYRFSIEAMNVVGRKIDESKYSAEVCPGVENSFIDFPLAVFSQICPTRYSSLKLFIKRHVIADRPVFSIPIKLDNLELIFKPKNPRFANRTIQDIQMPQQNSMLRNRTMGLDFQQGDSGLISESPNTDPPAGCCVKVSLESSAHKAALITGNSLRQLWDKVEFEWKKQEALESSEEDVYNPRPEMSSLQDPMLYQTRSDDGTKTITRNEGVALTKKLSKGDNWIVRFLCNLFGIEFPHVLFVVKDRLAHKLLKFEVEDSYTGLLVAVGTLPLDAVLIPISEDKETQVIDLKIAEGTGLWGQFKFTVDLTHLDKLRTTRVDKNKLEFPKRRTRSGGLTGIKNPKLVDPTPKIPHEIVERGPESDVQFKFRNIELGMPVLQGSDITIAWESDQKKDEISVHIHLFCAETNRYIMSLDPPGMSKTTSMVWTADCEELSSTCTVKTVFLVITSASVVDNHHTKVYCISNAFYILKTLTIYEFEMAYASFCRTFLFEMEHVESGTLEALDLNVVFDKSIKVCLGLRNPVPFEPADLRFRCPGQYFVSRMSRKIKDIDNTNSPMIKAESIKSMVIENCQLRNDPELWRTSPINYLYSHDFINVHVISEGFDKLFPFVSRTTTSFQRYRAKLNNVPVELAEYGSKKPNSFKKIEPTLLRLGVAFFQFFYFLTIPSFFVISVFLYNVLEKEFNTLPHRTLDYSYTIDIFFSDSIITFFRNTYFLTPFVLIHFAAWTVMLTFMVFFGPWLKYFYPDIFLPVEFIASWWQKTQTFVALWVFASSLLWFILGALINSESFLPYAVMLGSTGFVIYSLWTDFVQSRHIVSKFIEENSKYLLSIVLDHWFASSGVNFSSYENDVLDAERNRHYNTRISEQFKHARKDVYKFLPHVSFDTYYKIEDGYEGLSPSSPPIAEPCQVGTRLMLVTAPKDWPYKCTTASRWILTNYVNEVCTHITTIDEAHSLYKKIDQKFMGDFEIAMLKDGYVQKALPTYRIQSIKNPDLEFPAALVTRPIFSPVEKVRTEVQIDMLSQRIIDLEDNSSILQDIKDRKILDIKAFYRGNHDVLKQHFSLMFPPSAPGDILEYKAPLETQKKKYLSSSESSESSDETESSDEETNITANYADMNDDDDDWNEHGIDDKINQDLPNNFNAKKLHRLFHIVTQQKYVDEVAASVEALAHQVVLTQTSLMYPMFGLKNVLTKSSKFRLRQTRRLDDEPFPEGMLQACKIVQLNLNSKFTEKLADTVSSTFQDNRIDL
eukprot:GHVP01042405.1.p1 GENE.GHVP01042405.1~~GHVP01042405.1.p1  ORF type:complete len:2017 (+),score=296.19 GHVP01042405.1:54-6104(+)